MKNSGSDGHRRQQQKSLGGGGGRGSGSNNGLLSFRSISSYLRIVSSGASTVAKSAASAVAQSIVVDRDADADAHDQVQWAGFDKLEGERGVSRWVLLLAYRSGFQVWDVEEADNVRDLVSRHDGPVSFLQMLPKPVTSKSLADKFADSRPLLVVCGHVTLSGGSNVQDGLAPPSNGTIPNYYDSANGSFMPTVVRFYSLRLRSYVHMLKFRSGVYSVRCSSRIVAVAQAAQIHCYDATTLEMQYTFLTNPTVLASPGSGGTCYGPLAVGSRWLAYSGSPVVVSNSGRVSPQHLTPSASFPGFSSNGSLVAHYAKESSKQLAARIVTLGDKSYKKFTQYCAELGNNQSGTPGWKGNGTVKGHSQDVDNMGMVVVRDIVSKVVIAQFRAHKSPISALCFDPSGTLLVTASVQGHNINVFKIMPGLVGNSTVGDAGGSYAHLYRLQRGLTNAVIQDISFSNDSNWIMISSSRGTNHLFAINPLGGSVNFQSLDGYAARDNGIDVMTKPPVRWPPSVGFQAHGQPNLCAPGPPVTLSVVSRIRNGTNGWRGTVTGAAAAATGRLSSLSGAIASSFHNCKANSGLDVDGTSLKTKYHLLVFSPSGCMIQYALRISAAVDSMTSTSGLSTAFEPSPEGDGRLVVDAIQKWNILQKQSRRERDDNIDIYGENGSSDSNKIYPEGMNTVNGIHPEGPEGPEGQTVVPRDNISTEEKHHVYISEAELQMHQTRVPLWAKPEISFQSMIMEGISFNEDTFQGEIEIERIPTRMIEARSKDLVPLFDYLQTPRFSNSRVPALEFNVNGRLQHQRSGLSENGRLSRRSSSGSLDSMTDCGVAVAEETDWSGPRMPSQTRGFVNSNDGPKTNTQLETVNNSESLRMEAQLKFVNNNKEGLKMENHFEDEGDEFD